MRDPETYTVTCPTCLAAPLARCETPKGVPLAGAHVARMEAQHPACVNCGCRESTHPIETCRTFRHPDSVTSESPLAFTAPDGYVLGYHVTREAWYAQTSIPGDHNVLTVGLFNPSGGEKWSFAIDNEPLGTGGIGGGALRVGVFDDAWQAFAAIPEVFVALGERLGNGALVEEVTELLDEFGFEDLTKRESPHSATS